MSSLPPISAWQAEALRFTFFAAPGAEVHPEKWFRDLTGKDPETFTKKGGQTQADGPFLSGQLTFASSHGPRFDWTLNAKESPDSDSPAYLGSLDEVLPALRASIMSWLAQSQSYVRLAFGAVLNRPVQTRVEGYQLLRQYMHSVQVDPESEDFFYQINRPTTSRSGIRINRLSRWSVAVRHRLIITTVVDKEASGSANSLSEPVGRALRLDLDVNTAPSESPLEDPKATIAELIEAGLEIAEKGDVTK